ncbi:MAG: hypothetical protein M1444_02415 [Patescibacteria group bacterium]|nr:hypothetical protein [Patescibacteria group bacterium]MCL6096516.1 hypothetical protein [Patescibacteria group bacterium]
MKIQDFAFLIVFAVLILKRNPVLSAYAGIASLVLSIPLFYFWIFFTAERLTWYAAAFFLLSIILHIFNKNGYRN